MEVLSKPKPLQNLLDIDFVEELYVTNGFKSLKSCSSVQILHLKISELDDLDISFVERLAPKALVMEFQIDTDDIENERIDGVFTPLKAIIPGLQDFEVKLQVFESIENSEEDVIS